MVSDGRNGTYEWVQPESTERDSARFCQRYKKQIHGLHTSIDNRMQREKDSLETYWKFMIDLIKMFFEYPRVRLRNICTGI